MLTRLKKMDTPEKVFYGVVALLVIGGVCLSFFTRQKTVELAAGPANCTVDAAHYSAHSDGSVTILKGAVVECDRYVAGPGAIRFTVKKAS